MRCRFTQLGGHRAARTPDAERALDRRAMPCRRDCDGATSVPAEAEGVAGRIEIHPERVASRLAGLNRMLRRAQCQHLVLDGVDIVDGHIEVKLLRPLAR